jgi:hypothetical protein
MKSTTARNDSVERGSSSDESWLEIVRRQVGSLNFGVVQIVVHGARVVQIERTEKVRFANPIALSEPAD